MNAPLFEISDLRAAPASVESGADILNGLSLTIRDGEVHAIMGPNGSGKSTLASTLMGSPEYRVTGGTIRYKGDDITNWPVDERAKAGMFLAFQYPQEVSGVPVRSFLRQAMGQRKGIEDMSILEVRVAMMEWMTRLDMDPAELRLKNLIKPDQFPYMSPTGWEYDSGEYEKTMRVGGSISSTSPDASMPLG